EEMGRIRVAMTKITLTFKLCFGKTSSDSNASQQLDAPISPDNNTSQRVDAPISFGRRSSDHNASQQLDAPISSASTSHTDESLHSDTPTLPFPNGEYEVFLNFRGPDTRRNITDLIHRFLVHLKIRTFRDDDELRVGEGIWPELVRAIGQSKIYVVIFSEGYADSKWCLKELAEIVEQRKQGKGHIVIPIFHMVDPSDVRHQTGSYEDSFRGHQMEFDERIVQNWKNAMKEVGNLKGYPISEEGEGATADLVSNLVWSYLSKNNYALETDELIGIENHVEEVVHKLSLESGSVSTVGIHGMGGIGKTTLAMAVYNKISAHFDRCSFLENIRQKQQETNGILALQKKLISNILRLDSVGSMVDAREGRRIIKERVSQFRVLIVLDDVDEKFKFEEILGNFENFFPNSRFIVTSRNVKILKSLGRDRRCELYEAQGMTPDRSLQLFCKHAFGMDSPPPGFETLSKDIVSTTGGLPLTLKVVGSSLFKEDVGIWKDKFAKLKEIPETEVVESLKISYDTLAHEAKQIFLDIACFFIGEDKENASYMWSDCNFYPITNINILIQRSMIKIGNLNEFQMHDQLRDTGRAIVREEDIDHPWLRSRIWSRDVATDLLLNKKGTDKVKAIRVNSILGLESEHFSNLSELRYFDGQATSLRGDFSGLLPNLRWLQLQHHEESPNGHLTNFHMKNLVIFNFSFSELVGDDWGGWSHIKMAKKLKVLDLSDPNPYLTKLPKFPESGSLEMLNISNFAYLFLLSSYVELDTRNLLNLKVLNLNNCKLRKIKGGTLGMMKGLRELDLTNIKFIEDGSEWLADIGELPLLEILRAEEASFDEYRQFEVLAGIKLPTSLKVLTTSSALANLAELLQLRELSIIRCRTRVVIPETSTLWWKSSKLESLTLFYSPNLIMAPNATLLPSSLTMLSINFTTLEWLPNLENLENLIELILNSCSELREIQGLVRLKRLQSLTIDSASRLTCLDGLGDLMSGSNCKLTKLTMLDCPLLTTALDDDCRSALDVVHSFQEMHIDGCPRLDGDSIPRLSKLPRLKILRIGGISRSDGDHDGSALLEGLGELKELVELELVRLPAVERLPSLSKLRQLRRLVLWDIPNLREIEGLEGLKSLKRLVLAQCKSLERFPAASLPSTVVRMILDLRGCTNFTSDLSSLAVSGSNVTIRWPHEPITRYPNPRPVQRFFDNESD
ncbi:unnamed protein product, partial [Linum tenue]